MRALSASQLLDAWELGLLQAPVQRALTLLAAASPDSSWDDLAELPIGRRDRGLVILREILFGPRLALVSTCPSCGQSVECEVPVSELLGLAQPPNREWPRAVEIDGYRIVYRLPVSRDLLALSPTEEPATLRSRLLARCVLEAHEASGASVSAELLPPEIMAGIAKEMATADPEGDAELQLACGACAHRWQAVFDIADVLWREVHAWAHRTLRDVHALARAYGWREADVLALSPTRRHLYLELCRH